MSRVTGGSGSGSNKLRSSISTSAHTNRHKIKKKLAFSDDEILNARSPPPHHRHTTGYDTDDTNLDKSAALKHKSRSSSLTKTTSGRDG